MKIELRADSVNISGYVNVVERESRTLRDLVGQFVEKVKAKTFDRAIAEADKVELRFNHSRVIGDTATNLELREDAIGLHATCTITDPEVVEKARNNELRGWSFSFHAKKDHWETRSDGMRLRTLESIALNEVSILDCTPAYIATSVEVRADGDSQQVLESRAVEDSVELVDLSQKAPDEEKTEAEKRAADDALKMAKYKQKLELIKQKTVF